MIALPTFRGALAGFNPRSLSPALWLNDTGSDASVWTDISGNGRNAVQATGANQPSIVTGAINGRQVRRFDGVDDYLLTSTVSDWIFLHSSVSSTFIVFRAGNTVDPETFYVLCGTTVSVATPGGAYYAHDTRSALSRTDAILHVIGIGGPNTVNARQNAVAGNTWAIMSVIGDPVNATFANRSKIWSNGSGPTAANTEFISTAANAPRHSLAIGSAQNSSNVFAQFLTGDIAEILVFPTALSDVNRQKVERYLAGKYAITI
jgi:hypothetical protein